jgi:hypothetical protein
MGVWAYVGFFKKARKLFRAEIVPGKLFVTVYANWIASPGGRIRCWTYVSDGLRRHGQREIAFALRRPPGWTVRPIPRSPLGLFKLIDPLAEGGQLVGVGGFTVFTPDSQFLGRDGKWGLMYLPAEKLAGVAIPPNALMAVLIRDDETDLVQQGLFYRIAASLAAANRYLPYPPWSDIDREAVVTAEQCERSLLNGIKRARMEGAQVRTRIEVKGPIPKPGGVLPEGTWSLGDTLILRIYREALPKIRALLSDPGCPGPLALLTDPDPAAGMRLSWFLGSTKNLAPSGPMPARWITGGFIILNHGEGITDQGMVLEDGFVMQMGPDSWEKLRAAVAAGLPIKIPPVPGGMALEVEYFPPFDPSQEMAFRVEDILIYNKDAQLTERDVDAHALSDYVDRLTEAVSSVLARYYGLDARGLLIAVGVKPGKRVKIWCEAFEGEMPDATLAELEAKLESVVPADPKNGPIAFRLAGPICGRTVKSHPEFPEAWGRVSALAGKKVRLPDGLFKVIWPD